MAKRDLNLAADLIIACTGGPVSSDEARKAVRALCRYFGGQMTYIPGRDDGGAAANHLRCVLGYAVGEYKAGFILEKIMRLYGAMQLYIPLERKAFHKTIAKEIYEGVGKNHTTMNDLARKYGIAANTAYTLYYEARDEKLQQQFSFMEIEKQ
jgi:Mor family transcriptional regulator